MAQRNPVVEGETFPSSTGAANQQPIHTGEGYAPTGNVNAAPAPVGVAGTHNTVHTGKAGTHSGFPGHEDFGAGTTTSTEIGVGTGTGTGTAHQTGGGVKGVVAGIHGLGEKIRGEFNAGVDEAFKDTQGTAKNRAVADAGDRERLTGTFAGETKNREGAIPGADHGRRY